MKEYKISDYSIFENARTTNNTFKTKMEDLLKTLEESQSALNNDIFMGPINDNCQEIFTTLNTEVNTIITSINKTNTYFNNIINNYQTGDKEATNTIINSNIDSSPTTKNSYPNYSDTSPTTSSITTPSDCSNYSNNTNCGFNVSTGHNAYNLSDADKDILYAVVSAESDGSKDDALAVATTILNRCDDPKWNSSYGNNPIGQISAPNQFEVWSSGAYKKYLNGNSSDSVKQSVNDALAGVRNHNYLSFRSNRSTGYSNNMISATGNRYK